MGERGKQMGGRKQRGGKLARKEHQQKTKAKILERGESLSHFSQPLLAIGFFSVKCTFNLLKCTPIQALKMSKNVLLKRYTPKIINSNYLIRKYFH
jgi:hypothetical protein